MFVARKPTQEEPNEIVTSAVKSKISTENCYSQHTCFEMESKSIFSAALSGLTDWGAQIKQIYSCGFKTLPSSCLCLTSVLWILGAIY